MTLAWDGSALGGSSAGGEPTCVDGTNCDVFTIHLTGKPEDYAGKQVVLKFTWNVPATDYDFYIHKDTVDGPQVATGSNGGAPATGDSAAFNPTTSGVGDYVVHVVYFTAPPTDQYHGTAQVKSAATDGAATRKANYVTGGIQFSNNVALKAPATLRDGEPSNRTDRKGNAYVGAIRGFPAGVDLWYFDLDPSSPSYDPNMRVPLYRGQPDAFSPAPALGDLGGDGGGDIDLAVGFGAPAGQANPTLAFSSLIAANVSTGNSTDRADTYNKNPLGNVTGGVAADDRQWEEFLGSSAVYLFYRTLEPAITQIQRSDDGGFTFGPAVTAGTTSQVGPIDVHQASGTVYAGTSTGTVAVGTPASMTAAPTTYDVHQAASDPNGVAHLFFVTKVADDGTPNGTVYVCYSNDTDIFLKHSTDKGKTWSKPVRVNDGTSTKVNVFPWMETGPRAGSVGVVWYGTSNAANDDKAEWRVYYAQSFNATAPSPTFRSTTVTEPEHIIHASNISEGGLTGAANRNLIDYFQISFDPNGAAVVAYTDDHNDYDGHTYVARQISGPSIRTGAALPPPNEGKGIVIPDGTSMVDASDIFPPRQPGYNGEQVVDFAQDVQNGQVVRERVNDPSDILSVRYDTSGSGNSLAIAATMHVSDLSVIPGQTTWQMNFAVNAPHTMLSNDGTYSFAASDHADQFYVQADTDPSGAQTFTYGTAARASDGKIIYTPRGQADAGIYNQQDNTVSVQISVAKLNAILPAGHPHIKDGTVVAGLRARSYTIEVVPPVEGQASRQGRRDIARGGTQFVVHDYAFAPPAATPMPTPTPPPAVTPAPGTTAPIVELANISTRLNVKTGDDVGIAGFIIRSSDTKRVIIRGIGPSLGGGLAGALKDPVLEVYDSTHALIATNDDWRGPQQAEITATGLAPKDNREPAIILDLAGGSYTAIVKGKNGAHGLGLVEVYDIDANSVSDLANISTRGPVGVDANVLIGGIIVRDRDGTNQPEDVLVRGIGPSLSAQNIPHPLADPTLTLYDGQGTEIASNDNWQDAPNAGAISATKLQPTKAKEAAILKTLSPGAYTAILRGSGGGTGVGLVEAYGLR